MSLLLRIQSLRSGIFNRLLSLGIIILWASIAQAADSQALAGAIDLQTALARAQAANPELRVAQREREAVAGDKIQAERWPNPYFSTSIQDTRSETRQTTVQLSQPIELGGKRSARIDAAEAADDKAGAALASKEAELHANVVAAFYALLAAQARLNLAQDSLQIANLALDAASKRVRAGKSPPVEETKSKIAESGAKIALMQAQSQLDSSRKRLSSLWGNASTSFSSAEGEIGDIPESGDLNALMAKLDAAPALRVAALEVQLRAMQTTLAQSLATPDITVSAGVVNNQELGLNQALLGLSVPIPVFDRNQGGIQTAVSREYQAKDALLALQNQLSTNLASEYAQLSAAKAAASALRNEILPGAQSAFAVANKGFVAGKFNFLEVLDAQRTLFQTESQYIDALLLAHQSIAEIERMLGPVIKHPAAAAMPNPVNQEQ